MSKTSKNYLSGSPWRGWRLN